MIPMNSSVSDESPEENELNDFDENYWLGFLDQYQHEGIGEGETPYGFLTHANMQGRHQIQYKDRFDYLQEYADK